MRSRPDADFDRPTERPTIVPVLAAEIESVGPGSGLPRYGILLVAVIAVLVIGAALVGRYAAAPQVAPSETQPPTPFPWIAAVVESSPQAVAWPAGTPSPAPTPTATPKMDVKLEATSGLYAAGDTVHFIVTLYNPTGYSMTIDGCPTYRMALLGSMRVEPERTLNCHEWSGYLEPWATISFQMEFPLPADAEPGQVQLIWGTTSVVQASGHLTLMLGFPQQPTPVPTI